MRKNTIPTSHYTTFDRPMGFPTQLLADLWVFPLIFPKSRLLGNLLLDKLPHPQKFFIFQKINLTCGISHSCILLAFLLPFVLARPP